MRSVWFLILFGSLITYHCFTTVSGEAVSSSEPQPSFSQCKPYVDAALKSSSDPAKSVPEPSAPPDDDSQEGDESGEPASSEVKTTSDEETTAEDNQEDGDSTESADGKSAEEDGDVDSNEDGNTQEDAAVSTEDRDSVEDENATTAADDDEDDDDEQDSKEGDEAGATTEDTGETDEAGDTTEAKSVEDEASEAKGESAQAAASATDDSEEEASQEEEAVADSNEETQSEEQQGESEGDKSQEDAISANKAEGEGSDGDTAEDTTAEAERDGTLSDSVADQADEPDSTESQEKQETEEVQASTENDASQTVESDQEKSAEEEEDKTEEDTRTTEGAGESEEDVDKTVEEDKSGEGADTAEEEKSVDDAVTAEDTTGEAGTAEDTTGEEGTAEDTTKSGEDEETSKDSDEKSGEDEETIADGETKSGEDHTTTEDTTEDTTVEGVTAEQETAEETKSGEDEGTTAERSAETAEVTAEVAKSAEATPSAEDQSDEVAKSAEEEIADSGATAEGEESEEAAATVEDKDSREDDEEEDEVAVDYIPRSRDHLIRILGLDESDRTKDLFTLSEKVTLSTLKELKNVYENAIKPLEKTFKYRDLSNRHFGDPEIFSKPMVVFMGPWSGGKSTTINWLLGIENEEGALRTGADPSPAQFNIMVYGKEDEVLDGTQLAADWTFSGLQKFGQSFLDRLRGRKLPNRLLEKVNLVEIPGILEVRKQVERSFPFNDACQWFIDRADVLFLVYDPAKLDIGPETEAILDQLKGRENQVRIVLNKADSVRADELLRVQATLIWNISPLMSSAEPPVLYAASLWGRPLQPDSPKSLLNAHEESFLKDIRDATEKRVETRIAAARRFAVRVRNHAKMVDCYLNTYNNHRSFFSDKKKISNDIIDHPQNYHIYEGLSTLTNISRYDLPDPDTYRDFFKLNPLWEFPSLSATCTYFRGCPINKLDIAIAYELPEILGKYRRQREAINTAQESKPPSSKSK